MVSHGWWEDQGALRHAVEQAESALGGDVGIEPDRQRHAPQEPLCEDLHFQSAEFGAEAVVNAPAD